jgi:hypothetical protein
MAGRAKAGLALVAVGALAAALVPLAGATGEQASGAAKRHNAIISILRGHGKVNGTVVVVRHKHRARVSASLHHLAPGTTYVVAASTIGCSHAASDASRALRVVVKTGAGDDAFKSPAARLSNRITKVRSVRVYRKRADGKFHQASCRVVDNADVFQ